MTTKVGKNLRNVYDSVADAKADVSLRIGEDLEIKKQTGVYSKFTVTSDVTPFLMSNGLYLRLNEKAEVPEQTIFAAHRGAKTAAPENTLAALEQAARVGFTHVEFDVQRTNEGEWIVFHDEALDALTDGTGNARDKTLAELKALDAGSSFSTYYAGEKIPTFAEYLIKCKELQLSPIAELKTYVFPTNAEVQEFIDIIIDNYGIDGAIASSATDTVITQLRALNLDLELIRNTTGVVQANFDFCENIGRCWVGTPFNSLPTDASYLEDQKIPLCIYTPNAIRDLDDAFEVGVSLILSDIIDGVR